MKAPEPFITHTPFNFLACLRSIGNSTELCFRLKGDLEHKRVALAGSAAFCFELGELSTCAVECVLLFL